MFWGLAGFYGRPRTILIVIVIVIVIEAVLLRLAIFL